MKKTRLSFLLLLPLLIGGLSGCKQEQPSQSEGPEITSVNVKFWHTFGQTVQNSLNEKINSFKNLVKEHDGVDVNIELIYQGGYDDIATKIRNGYSVGNKPTIAVAYPDHIADYLEISKSAGEEFVVNLDKFIDSETVGFGKESWLGDEEDETDFVEDFFEEGKAHIVPGTYSLPYMKSTEIMFYNLDLLIDAFQYYKPEFESSKTKIVNYMKRITWDDFMELCAVINEHKEDISNMLEVPFWYDSDANFLITKMYQNRIAYSSILDSGKGHIDFAEGEAYNATKSLLTTLKANYDAGLFTTKGIKNTYGSDFFTNEKCIFSIGSSGGSGYNFPQAEAFELGVCRVPASNNNAMYVTQGPTIALFSDSGLSEALNEATQLYAWKFMKYITNGQINAELCVNGSEGYVPVRYSAYSTEFFQEFMEDGEKYAQCYRVVVDDITNYLVTPCFKGSAKLRDECGSLLTAVLNAEDASNIDTLMQRAIDNATLAMQSIKGGYYEKILNI